MKKTYDVEVDCANCAAKMEEAVKNTEGVKNATLSFMTLKLKVEFEEGADVDAVMQQAYKNCKVVEDDCEIFYKKNRVSGLCHGGGGSRKGENT